jgi:ubiquitin C-terminal hydrolase
MSATITELFVNLDVAGQALIEPLQCYGRQISNLFQELPVDGVIAEVAKRVFMAITALVLLPLITCVVAPLSLVGFTIKFCGYVFGNISSRIIEYANSDQSEDGANNDETSVAIDYTAEERQLLLSDKNRIGMSNGSTHCFFNAIFQLIMNSELLSSFLIDKANLQTSKEDLIPEENQLFYNYWEGLVLSYHQAARDKQAHLDYNKKKMRSQLDFNQTGQQDAAEAFQKIFGFYRNLSLFDSSQTDKVDLAQKKKLTEKLKHISEADGNGKIALQGDKTNILTIQLGNDNEADFDRLIARAMESTEKTKEPEGRKFSYQGEQYFVTEYTKNISYKYVQNELFFLAKRWDTTINYLNGKPQLVRSIKNRTKLGMRSTHTIGQDSFDLTGFVVHLGATGNSGHYVAYCKTAEGWYKFNDAQPVELISEETAIAQANDAFILHFKKQGETATE